MEHTMNLNPSPFSKIKSGMKTIELRLYDEKRRRIAIGDAIRFCNSENVNETILTKVLDLYVFDTFDELYEKLPLLECGYTENNICNASAKDMEKYYSIEMQKQFGVVGIRIAIVQI